MVIQSVQELEELSEGTHAELPQRRTRAELQEKCSKFHEETDLISSYTRNTEPLKKEVFM